MVNLISFWGHQSIFSSFLLLRTFSKREFHWSLEGDFSRGKERDLIFFPRSMEKVFVGNGVFFSNLGKVDYFSAENRDKILFENNKRRFLAETWKRNEDFLKNILLKKVFWLPTCFHKFRNCSSSKKTATSEKSNSSFSNFLFNKALFQLTKINHHLLKYTYKILLI